MMQIQQRPSAANTEALIFTGEVNPLWWGWYWENTLWPNNGRMHKVQGLPCEKAVGEGLRHHRRMRRKPRRRGWIGTPPLVYTR